MNPEKSINQELENSGEFRLFLFVFDGTNKILTRGRSIEEAKKVMQIDTDPELRGRTYHIVDVATLSQEEQRSYEEQYSSSHQFDWKNTLPKILENP